jgi:hypothetical protein
VRHGRVPRSPHEVAQQSRHRKDERLLLVIKEFDALLTCQGYDADW